MPDLRTRTTYHNCDDVYYCMYMHTYNYTMLVTTANIIFIRETTTVVLHKPLVED